MAEPRMYPDTSLLAGSIACAIGDNALPLGWGGQFELLSSPFSLGLARGVRGHSQQAAQLEILDGVIALTMWDCVETFLLM